MANDGYIWCSNCGELFTSNTCGNCGEARYAPAHMTAIARRKPSAPVAALFKDNALRGRILDYGCGRGSDVAYLNAHRIECSPVVEGFDPHFSPSMPQGKFDTILCTYVLNVIEDYEERRRVLHRIADALAPGGVAYVTVRRDLDETGRTSKGTWQGIIVVTAPAHVALHRSGAFITYKLSRHELRAAGALACKGA